ncbi:MAG: hypothetical protein ACJAVS_000121 [Paracoccaceae bacterium]|jgi:hypothetical protein
MRLALILVAAAAISLGSGCAGPGGITMVHTVLIDPLYHPEDLRATGAPIPARVVGEAPGGASVSDTLAALSLPGRLGARPARAEKPQDFPALRLVFAFSPLPPSRICDQDAGEGAVGSGTEISAALCRGDRQLTYGILRAEARGPGDPGFRAAVLHLYGSILPRHGEDQRPHLFGLGAV